MRARRTHASTTILTLPGGNEDNDLYCEHLLSAEGSPIIASVWEPTPEERTRLAAGQNVRLLVWGTRHPPVAIQVTDVPIGRAPKESM